MILFFIIIIACLVICLGLIFLENNKISKSYDSEIIKLKNIIADLLQLQNKQSGALKLSDELKIKLQESRVQIDKNLLNLQSELIEKLIENKLID